jgi:hypothetical protein
MASDRNDTCRYGQALTLQFDSTRKCRHNGATRCVDTDDHRVLLILCGAPGDSLETVRGNLNAVTPDQFESVLKLPHPLAVAGRYRFRSSSVRTTYGR